MSGPDPIPPNAPPAGGSIHPVIAAAGLPAVSAWQDFLTSRAIAVSTRRVRRSIVLRFLNWLEPQGVALAEVTAVAVDGFLDHCDVRADSTPIYRGSLRHFFTELVAHGVLAGNPAGRLSQRGATTGRGLAHITSEIETMQRAAYLQGWDDAMQAILADLNECAGGDQDGRAATSQPGTMTLESEGSKRCTSRTSTKPEGASGGSSSGRSPARISSSPMRVSPWSG
jgi:hypothetical protein